MRWLPDDRHLIWGWPGGGSLGRHEEFHADALVGYHPNSGVPPNYWGIAELPRKYRLDLPQPVLGVCPGQRDQRPGPSWSGLTLREWLRRHPGGW